MSPIPLTTHPLDMPLLTVMVGLPRSGKSTFCRALAEAGTPVVCCDDIRKAMGTYPYIPECEPMTRYHEEVMVKALLHAGCPNIIIDSTHLTRARRQRWEDIKGARVRYVYVPTPAAECIRRAKATGQPYLIPVIEKMWAEFEPLTVGEWERAINIHGGPASEGDIPA